MRTPREALTDALPAIQAAAEGKEVEYRRIDEPEAWCLACQPALWKLKAFANPSLLWRPKPEPKRTLRPWKPEEVPVGALLRVRNKVGASIIVGSGNGEFIGIAHMQGLAIGRTAYSDALDHMEHSTDPIGTPDSKRAWHPCGVWEGEA